MMIIKLADVLDNYRPESWGSRGETWPEHADYLWASTPGYMSRMTAHMRKLGAWFGGPMEVDDDVVQDGHHRIVIAAELGMYTMPIPVDDLG